MNPDSSLDPVIVRIRKLLTLARGGATEAEAEQAMRTAHALLARHNLRLGEVERAPARKEEQRVIDSDTVDGPAEPWRRSIWHATAGLYFCKYFFTPVHGCPGSGRRITAIRHTLVGRPHNVLVAKLMTEYFVATVRRLARDAVETMPLSERRSYEMSFKNACADRLAQRIWERRHACNGIGGAAGQGGNLPALRSLYAVEMDANLKLLAATGIRLTSKQRRRRITNVLGAHLGRAAANRIGLDTQIPGHRPEAAARPTAAQLELAL